MSVPAVKLPVWKAGAQGDVLNEAAETGGGHAGIAAVLIDLVAGRPDQERRVLLECPQHGGFDHQRVR